MKHIRWYKNNIIHIKSNFGRFINRLKIWVSYWKVSDDLYDWDYTSLLYIEKHQIERVKTHIEIYHDYESWSDDIKWMNVAINLLDIILEDGCAELLNEKYSIPVYVNTRNFSRFISNVTHDELFENPAITDLHKDALRLKKAWTLYYKLREQYTKRWWV